MSLRLFFPLLLALAPLARAQTPYQAAVQGSEEEITSEAEEETSAERRGPRGPRRPHENDDSLSPRERRPGYVGFAFGNPSPSMLGVVAGYQFTSALQGMISAGKLNWKQLSTTSFALTARFHIFPWALTPFVGGGADIIFLNGSGEIQGFDHSMSLPFLNAGADLMINGLRLAAGLNFHFPVQLIFPFVDVGYAF